MSHVSCAQFRYTWAERRLDGRGGGFGVVLRSADWPTGLLDDPRLRDLLTNIPGAVRQESPDTAVAVITHLRVRGGSLLVAKRPVGQDGAGRPGNYAVHALFDASATLGSLDLEPLVTGGTFVLERDVGVEPRDDAPSVTVWAAPDWRSNGTRGRSTQNRVEPQQRTYGDQPLTYQHGDDIGDLLRGLARRVPADLVNQLPLTRAGGPSLTRDERPSGGIDQLVESFAEAVALGVVDQDLWWTRQAYDAETWRVEVSDFVLMNQPIRQVPDGLLWKRWDGATERGKSIVAKEVLRRGTLTTDAAAVAEVSRRPDLLNEVLEAGLKGRAASRSAAAQWVAAAGDDDQVIDFAVELRYVDDDAGLPRPILERLQQQPPDTLPAELAGTVAEHLDGALPLDPVWRARCLQLRLAGEPTCVHPDQLISSSSKAELVEAVRTVVVEADDLDTCWAQLSPLEPVARAEILLPLGAAAADFLLRRDLAATPPSSPPLISLWPAISRELGWAGWSRALPLDLDRRVRQLQAQRLVLLIAVAVLALAAIVLAIL